MAGTSPIVCSVLKLPPDESPFFELKDVLDDMLRKFDHLNLVLASLEDENAAQLLRGARTAMAEHATTVLRAIEYTNDVSGQMPRLLDAVATDPISKHTLGIITYAARWAGNTANRFENGDQGITQLTTEITTMTERVASLFRDRKSNMKTSETAAVRAESEQLTAGLLFAAKKVASILHQKGEFYRDLQTHLVKLEESIKTTQPSEPELEMLRQRWTGFSTALEPLLSEVDRIQRRLEDPPPTVFRADDPATRFVIERANRENAPKRRSPPPGVKLLEAPVPAQSASARPPPLSTFAWNKTLSFFRRLFSCFVPKKKS